MARPLKHGEPKTERKLRMTHTGWEGAREIAGENNCPGIAELLEQIGRRELGVVMPDPEPKPDINTQLEEAINTVLMTIPPRDRVAAGKLFRKLSNQLKQG